MICYFKDIFFTLGQLIITTRYFIYSILLLLLIFGDYSYADTRPLVNDSLYSDKLKEKRNLVISLPKSYESNKKRHYSVLFLLDAKKNLSHTSGSLDYLKSYSYMPDLIVVGVVNNKRFKDFTPTKSKKYLDIESGEANQFLEFMEHELLPYIDRKYRTRRYKILAGHSLGGLLVVHSLISKPYLFQAHFAFSPSLWWDEQLIVNRAKVFFQETNKLENFLYINMGKESLKTTKGINAFKAIIKKNNPKQFEFISDTFLEESHVTTPVIGQYKAYRALYRDW
jgi:predicted alpha/beta superfamily hydrolase